AGATLQGGRAIFQQTLPDGVQDIAAEVPGLAADPSPPRSLTVRSIPPRVTAITLQEDLDGNLALSQSEMAATLHFTAVASGAIGGQALEIHSVSLGAAVLGIATAGPTGATVVVPLSAVAGGGGYQSHVF